MKSHSLLPLLGVLSTTVLSAPTLSPVSSTPEVVAAPVDGNLSGLPIATTVASLPYDVLNEHINMRLDLKSSKTLQLLTNKEIFGSLRRTEEEEAMIPKMKGLIDDKELFWAIINRDKDSVRRSMPNLKEPSLLLGLELALQYGNSNAAWLLLVWSTEVTERLEECNEKRKKLEDAARKLLTKSQRESLALYESSNHRVLRINVD